MLVYLNGQIVPATEAKISVFDRGFIFGDGVYEGLLATSLSGRRRVVGLQRHIRRLTDGLASVGIHFDAAPLVAATDELLDANHLAEAFVYWQVTRGCPPLDSSAPVRARVPSPGMEPTVFAYVSAIAPIRRGAKPALKRASTQPDRRWLNGTIKSISLLGNVQAMMAADDAGADEALLVRDGLLTEGTYTNVALAYDHGTELGAATPSLSSAPLLAGVTRQILLEHAPSLIQEAVPAHRLATAREILLLGTTTMITAVTHLDGLPVGTGSSGPVAQRLLDTLIELIAGEREDIPAVTPSDHRVQAADLRPG